MPSVLEDLQRGESFTDIPIVPAVPAKGLGAPQPVTPEVLAKFDEGNAQMREAFAKKGLPAPPLAPGEAERIAAKKAAADPFAAEQQVDAFAGEQEVKDAFSGERMADKLDEKSPQDLAKDPDFNILAHIAANKDNIFSDPRRYQKALDTYRAQKVEGLTTGKVLESAKKDTLPLVKDILKSIPKRLENISDIAVAPVVDAITAKIRGEALDPEKSAQWESMTEDAREAAIAEAIGGTQLAVGSLQDMVRQGARKLTGPGFKLSQIGVAPEGGLTLNKKDWSKISDNEVKDELFKDLGWHETVESIASGQTVKDLVSEGVEINPDNIKLLSLTDPITLVATGAGLKAMTTGGRVIFTAANELGATKALQYLAQAGKTAAAKSAQVVGRGAEATGAFINRVTPAPAITTGVLAGGVSGHGVKAMAVAAGVKGGAKIIEKGGQLLREVGEAAGAAPKGQLPLGFKSTTGAKVLNAAKAATAFVKPPVVGAVKGAVGVSPLALATDEPQGGLLGVGAIGGAVHSSLGAIKGSVAEGGAKRYFDPGQITWEKTSSPGYEGFTELNKVHEQVAAGAPENSRNMVDSLREVLRPFGRKLFLVDDAAFGKAIENDTVRANGGEPLTPEQQAAVAQEAKARGVSKIWMADDAGKGEFVTLVKSSADAPHEFSHVLETVMDPAAREKLHDAVREAYTPEELDALKSHYESQLGRGFTPEEVRSEFIADNWANLLYNTSLESLGLPQPKRGFRQVLLDAALSLGDALGVDMTAGRKTPGLNLRPSYSLRKALVNASGEIISERNQRAAQAATAPEKPVSTPAETAPPSEIPVEPAVPETAQGELPLFEQPSAQPTASPEAVPPPTVPEQAKVTPPAAPTSERASVTNTSIGQDWAKGKENEAAINEVNAAMDAGEGVKVTHAGAPKTTYKPTEAERAAEVEEGRGLPPEARESHVGEKYLTRWEQTKSGEPQVIARSLDKVVSNLDRVTQWAKASGETFPWETNADGSLTQAGLDNFLGDLKSYWDNQDRGFRGGGEPLVRPAEDIGLSIPEQRGEPTMLGEAKEQWLNLLQGKEVGPPETARAVKGKLPANIKAQELRKAQGLESERIAPGTEVPVYPAKATQGRGPVEVMETNPLRNKLRAAGMPVEQLHSVVERLNAADITAAERAPQLTGRGGQTDIARAGFLSEKPVSELVDDVNSATPEQWQQFFGPQGSLTRSAYEVGLGLKDRSDLNALIAAQESASKAATESMAKVKAGNFDALDEASAAATKAQFFREAIEAATDKGSAAGTSGWRKAFPDRTAPFAEGEAKGMKQFLSPEEMPDDVDPVVAAAIRTRDGKVYTGFFHGAAMEDLAAERGLTRDDIVAGYQNGEFVDGFTLKSGKFLDRAETAKHAEAIKQVKQPLVHREMESTEFAGKRAFMAEKPVPERGSYEDLLSRMPLRSHETFEYQQVARMMDRGLSTEDFRNLPYLDQKIVNRIADFIDKEKNTRARGYKPLASPRHKGVPASGAAPREFVTRAARDAGIYSDQLAQEFSAAPKTEYTGPAATAKVIEEMSIERFQKAGGTEGVKKVMARLANESLDDIYTSISADEWPVVRQAIRNWNRERHPEDFIPFDEAMQQIRQRVAGRFGERAADEVMGKNRAFLSEKALDPIRKGDKEGETFNADGTVFVPPHGKKLDVVTLASVNLPLDELNAKSVAAALAPYKAVLKEPNIKAGIFRLSEPDSEGNPQVSVDVNAIVDQKHRAESLAFAKANNQQAIFDLAAGETIDTGGTGDTFLKSPKDIAKAAKELQRGKNPLKSRRETEAEAQARVEATDYSKYNVPEEAKVSGTKAATGWFLPNQEFVPLDAAYHEQFLADNSAQLNKDYGTNFGAASDVGERLNALNKGFVRVRHVPSTGQMNIELAAQHWTPKTRRSIMDFLDEHSDNIDNIRVSLLDEQGATVDTVGGSVFKYEGAEKVAAMQDALDRLPLSVGAAAPKGKGPSAIQIARSREGYLTKEKLTPKTAEAAATSHNDEMTKTYPEALPTRFVRDSKGKLKLQQGKLIAADEEAVLDKTPLALDAVRDNPEAPAKEAIAEALSDKIVDEAKTALQDPEVAKGLTWYDDAVKLIKQFFGKDAGMFAQLLAATSPQNGVQTNFGYAIDAWNAVKRGEYEPFKAKYLEGREQWLKGGTPEIAEWEAETGKQWKAGTSNVAQSLRNNFLTWWVDKHEILPKREGGKLYGMHSFPVLDVISGTWLEDVGGPKVRNFLANLTGEGHEATIDIWATRFLMRIAQSQDTLQGRWRVSPPAGWGISAANFDLAQLAFRKAAEKMGTKPDALQALVWFAEKQLWEQNDWTKTVGAAKSDYAYWLRGLESGEAPETYNISAQAKAEAKRQGQSTGKGKKRKDDGQGELDIPLNPVED